MKLPRRKFLSLAAGAAALPAVSRIARAQAYPTKPVRIVVGFPPSGVSDLYARLVAQWLSERLGQQFVVENRVGVGGSLATEGVVRATRDGYTLLLTGSNDAWNAALYDNLTFNFVRDITPVASIARFMGVLVALPSLPLKTVPELIAFAKANPGKLTIASGGAGSSAHLYWELLKSMTAIGMLHVPYRGEGPALVDLLGGQVQLMIPNLPPAIEYIRTGRMRAMAVTTTTRAELLPDVPTVSEFVPGYEGSGWIGIGAPRNTPVAIVDILNREINRCLADPVMRTRMTELTASIFPSSPSEFGKYIAEYTDKWGKVIRAANIKL